jgi:hypothetical protein
MSVLRYFSRLRSRRDSLEDRLHLHEARRCFGSDDCEDGTTDELLAQISELDGSLSSLRYRPRR